MEWRDHFPARSAESACGYRPTDSLGHGTSCCVLPPIPVLDKRVGCRRRARTNDRRASRLSLSLPLAIDRSPSVLAAALCTRRRPLRPPLRAVGRPHTRRPSASVRPSLSLAAALAPYHVRERSVTVSRLLSQVTVVSARGYRPTDRLLGSASACTACPTDRLLRKSAEQGSATR